MEFSVAFKCASESVTDSITQWLYATTADKFNGKWRTTPFMIAFSVGYGKWFGAVDGEFSYSIEDPAKAKWRTYKLTADRKDVYNMHETAVLMIGSRVGSGDAATRLLAYIYGKSCIHVVKPLSLAELENYIKEITNEH